MPKTSTKMNTKFRYLYRDASNYKQHGEMVFRGSPTPALVELLKSSFDGGEFFYPESVGVKPVFFEEKTEDDHDMHEFDSVEETTEKPTDKRTFGQFVAECRKSAQKLPERVLRGGW